MEKAAAEQLRTNHLCMHASQRPAIQRPQPNKQAITDRFIEHLVLRKGNTRQSARHASKTRSGLDINSNTLCNLRPLVAAE